MEGIKEFWVMTLTRFFDYLKICCSVSVLISLIYYFGLIPGSSSIATLIVAITMASLFWGFQIHYSRQCRTAAGSSGRYLLVTVISYFFFVLVSLIIVVVFGKSLGPFLYQWFFYVTKSIRFMFGLDVYAGVACFHAVTLLLSFVMTFFGKKRISSNDEY